MIKLTSAQLELLVAAASRDDGCLTRPANLRSAAAASKLATKLVEAGLVRQVRAKAYLPVWREDAGKRFSLSILKAGRTAACAARGAGEADAATGTENVAIADPGVPHQPTVTSLGRPGSKRALIIGLLQRPNGVTLADLIDATGWLPHTTRAALTGLRKSGLAIDRCRDAQTAVSTYRLTPTATAEAA